MCPDCTGCSLGRGMPEMSVSVQWSVPFTLICLFSTHICRLGVHVSYIPLARSSERITFHAHCVFFRSAAMEGCSWLMSVAESYLFPSVSS